MEATCGNNPLEFEQMERTLKREAWKSAVMAKFYKHTLKALKSEIIDCSIDAEGNLLISLQE